MLRGQQAVILKFPNSIVTNSENKGHRNVHLNRRDATLTARFYYYYHIKRVRYDDILNLLEVEFFITPNIITQRLRLTGDYAKELVKKGLTINDLRKQYPLLLWVNPIMPINQHLKPIPKK